ncbi:MAG: hypothetical protein HY669_02515 [Chloroflexi bacterium]|nr:hypothetical protein [Chloroflexota bacterium]
MMTIRLPPMQRLLEYVVENYCKLGGFCETEGVETDVAKCVKCHRDSFYDACRAKYGCHNFMRLHVIRYLSSRVKPTSDLIGAHVLSDIGSRADLSVVALGGGPGTEALALINQLSSYDGKHNLTFDNIDREASWEPIYKDLVQTFAGWVQTIKTDHRFFSIDVTSNFTAGQYDVVFVSWILSLIDTKDRLSVLEKARDLARSGGYIVITDRTETDLVEEISTLTKRFQDWTVVSQDIMPNIHCGVQVPDEIQRTFWVELCSNTAYWVMKKD